MPSTTTTTPPPTLILSTGAHVPALGFGTYSASRGETYNAVLTALRAGYRHIDTASAYDNEEEVGAAIKDFLKEQQSEQGGVERKDLFVTTKLWNHMHEPRDVEVALEGSLGRLGLEYVDLYLIHWPVATEKKDNSTSKTTSDGKVILNKALTTDPTPTWHAMESLQKSGKTRSIGVSNFNIARLRRLLSSSTIPPSMNQVEIHPLFPNHALLSFCRAHNILLSAYSPLGGQGGHGHKLLENEKLAAIAQRKGCDVGRLLVGWGLARGYAVLPKSFREERIRGNASVVGFSEEEVREVEEAVGGEVVRFCDPGKEWGVDVWAEGE